MRGFTAKWKIGGIVASVAAAGGFMVGASAAPDPAPEATGAALHDVTREQVTAFAGAAPERCVFSRPDRQLCTWTLGGRLISASAAPATNGVNLVCELPIGDDSGFEGSCTPHPRSAVAELPPVSAGEAVAEAPRTAAPAIAVTEIADAPLLVDLSRRLGAAPDVCRTGIEQQTCIWRLSPEAVTRTFRAVDTGPLELRCTLPLDGSARAPESCTTVSLSS